MKNQSETIENVINLFSSLPSIGRKTAQRLTYHLLKQNDGQKDKLQKKEYTPIKTYKPSGNLVYDDDILNKIENKFI